MAPYCPLIGHGNSPSDPHTLNPAGDTHSQPIFIDEDPDGPAVAETQVDNPPTEYVVGSPA